MSLFEDKVKKYDKRLQKDLNLNRVQTAGIWGSIGGETGGFQHLQEINPTVKGSKGGFGWKQWTGPRRRAYTDWCEKYNYDPTSDEANYGYVVWEGRNTESHAVDQLRRTTTIKAATETYTNLDLRPGTPHMEGRINWANKAYAASATSTLPQGTGPVVATVTAATGLSYYFNTYSPYIIIGAIGLIGLYVLIKYIKYRGIKSI